MKRRLNQTVDYCTDEAIKSHIGSIKENNFLLTETDRLTYVYCIDTNKKVTVVINVSYDLLFKKKWITIVRFDSSHGYLHRHMRISLDNPDTITDSTNIIKRGNPTNWLTWAIRFTSKSYYDYKVGFCKRSKVNIIDL